MLTVYSRAATARGWTVMMLLTIILTLAALLVTWTRARPSPRHT
jgi:hypothetical protein